MTYTRMVVAAAPMKANQMYWVIPAMPNTPTPTVTASPAPALTPRTPESASGLRVSAWISAPARAKAAPVTMAMTVRGNRWSQTM